MLLKIASFYYDTLQVRRIKFFIRFALDESISYPCLGVTLHYVWKQNEGKEIKSVYVRWIFNKTF